MRKVSKRHGRTFQDFCEKLKTPNGKPIFGIASETFIRRNILLYRAYKKHPEIFYLSPDEMQWTKFAQNSEQCIEQLVIGIEQVLQVEGLLNVS